MSKFIPPDAQAFPNKHDSECQECKQNIPQGEMVVQWKDFPVGQQYVCRKCHSKRLRTHYAKFGLTYV